MCVSVSFSSVSLSSVYVCLCLLVCLHLYLYVYAMHVYGIYRQRSETRVTNGWEPPDKEVLGMGLGSVRRAGSTLAPELSPQHLDFYFSVLGLEPKIFSL